MNKQISLILLALMSLLLSPCVWAEEESVCASVELEIVQQLTLERQAFDARLVINNGLAGINLTDVSVTMHFAEGDGTSVPHTSDPNSTTNLFFVAAPSLNGIDSLPGGTVFGGTLAEMNWLIIPAIGASDDQPDGKIYYVGATLTYKINGEETVVEITPDYIYVKPMPTLALDYFLPGDVYGDDAFSAEVEPPVPFAFGLRVRNEGFGTANSLKLVTSQPRITANVQGLVVGMELTGSSVHGQPVTPSLLLDFGNIESLDAKMAHWVMEVTLSGTFTNFTAEISHADELGGQLTSLIPEANVNTHLFLKDVVVDLPGRDEVIDFLVDGDSTVYESDGSDSPAAKCTSAYLMPAGTDRYTFYLNSSTTEDFVYASVPNPYPSAVADLVTLKSVVRSDGKRISDSNAWLSKTRPGTEWDHYLNLFDVDGADPSVYYTVSFEDSGEGNQAPVIYPIGPRMAYADQLFTLTVAAYDPDGIVPALSVNAPVGGTAFVLNTNVADLAVGTLSWMPSQADASVVPYNFEFTADDGFVSASGQCWITVVNTPQTAGYPDWWLSRGVINTNSPVNDYAPINIGQAKYLTAMAWEEFNLLPGGAGIPAIDFTNGNDYAAVNIGQLKTLAVPFYDRIGMTNSYPWLASTNPVNDYAIANIGQAKYLFSFVPLKDSDADGMPDWWEMFYMTNATAMAAAADPDADNRSNLSEYLNNTDPTVSD